MAQPAGMQCAQAGPAGFFNSGISSAVQHIVQAPQDFPMAAVKPLGPPGWVAHSGAGRAAPAQARLSTAKGLREGQAPAKDRPMTRSLPSAVVAFFLSVALGLALVLPAPSSDTRELLSWG